MDVSVNTAEAWWMCPELPSTLTISLQSLVMHLTTVSVGLSVEDKLTDWTGGRQVSHLRLKPPQTCPAQWADILSLRCVGEIKTLFCSECKSKYLKKKHLNKSLHLKYCSISQYIVAPCIMIRFVSPDSWQYTPHCYKTDIDIFYPLAVNSCTSSCEFRRFEMAMATKTLKNMREWSWIFSKSTKSFISTICRWFMQAYKVNVDCSWVNNGSFLYYLWRDCNSFLNVKTDKLALEQETFRCEFLSRKPLERSINHKEKTAVLTRSICRQGSELMCGTQFV